MNIQIGRKIKFWLSLISKVLIITLVLFKLTPYILDFVSDKTEAAENNNQRTSVLDSSKNIMNPEVEPVDKASRFESLNTVEETDAVFVSKTTTDQKEKSTFEISPRPKSIGFLIFNGNIPDIQIAGQLEKTFFETYFSKPILLSETGSSRKQLFLGNIGAITEVETVCIGTVSYVYTQKGAKITCTLSLNFDSYATATGFKVKELSSSLTRYGIGFSKKQAKQVAINKVN